MAFSFARAHFSFALPLSSSSWCTYLYFLDRLDLKVSSIFVLLTNIRQTIYVINEISEPDMQWSRHDNSKRRLDAGSAT